MGLVGISLVRQCLLLLLMLLLMLLLLLLLLTLLLHHPPEMQTEAIASHQQSLMKCWRFCALSSKEFAFTFINVLHGNGPTIKETCLFDFTNCFFFFFRCFIFLFLRWYKILWYGGVVQQQRWDEMRWGQKGYWENWTSAYGIDNAHM